MMQNINLLTELNIQPTSWFNSRLMLQIAVGWILLLIMVLTIALGIRSSKLQSLKELKANQNSLTSNINSYNQTLSLFHEQLPLGIEAKSLPTNSGSLLGFYRYLKDLASFTPQGVWLNNIYLSEIDNNIIIAGSTISDSGVSALIEALGKSISFQDKKFGMLQIQPDPESNNTNFTISNSIINPNATGVK